MRSLGREELQDVAIEGSSRFKLYHGTSPEKAADSAKNHGRKPERADKSDGQHTTSIRAAI